MKRLRISSLMDEYTDTEFFPKGGSAIDPETIKERVLASAKVRTKKKQMPRKKKMLLAAALAAALVLLVGAGFPYFQHRLVHGNLSFEQTANGGIIALVHYNDVVEYEDGRLFFNQKDGPRIDITDQVSEETPYIYDGSDPDTGMIYYIIMGGTPESFGWFEWIQTPYPFDNGLITHFDENGNPVYIAFDFVLTNPENRDSLDISGFDTVYLHESMKLPWLLAGAEQLGITFEGVPEGEMMVASRTR